MKRVLLMLCLLVPAVARAEYLPEGCYVVDAELVSFSQCWTPVSPNTFNWIDYGSLTANASHYGAAAALYINEYNLNGDALVACGNDYNAAKAQLSACSSSVTTMQGQVSYYQSAANDCTAALNSNETNRQQWILYSKAQTKLISKLRKTCGSRCKKIK